MNVSFETLYIKNLINTVKTSLFYSHGAKVKNSDILEKAISILSKEVNQKLVIEKQQHGYALVGKIKLGEKYWNVQDFNKINCLNNDDFENYLTSVIRTLYV